MVDAHPALLDVVTARNELSMPPKIEAEQVKGSSRMLIKTFEALQNT